MASHYVLGGQHTHLVGVGKFDLDRRVVDAETVVKLLRDAVEHGIAGMPAGNHQVTGKSRFGCAHAPDVQIMQPNYAGNIQQKRAHGRGIDTLRHRVQGEADGALYQPPGADNDDGGDEEARRWIEPEPTGQPDRDPRGDDGGRDQRVGRHVDKGAPQIEVARTPRCEKQGRYPVDENASGGDPDYNAAGDRWRIAEAPHRLPGDAASHHQQDDRIGKGGEDRAAAQPVGEAVVRSAAAQNRRTPGQREREHVAKVVPGIGEWNDRHREDPGNRFARYIDKVERDPDSEGPPVVEMGMHMTMPDCVRGAILLHRVDHNPKYRAGWPQGWTLVLRSDVAINQTLTHGATRGRRISTRAEHLRPAHGGPGGFRTRRRLAAFVRRPHPSEAVEGFNIPRAGAVTVFRPA